MARRRASKGKTASALQKKGRNSSSNKRWASREDIPLDEVDQFHEQRDRILLEEDDDINDSEDGEEEVFALKGIEPSSEEDDEADQSDRVDEDSDGNDTAKIEVPTRKRTTATAKKGKKPLRSDEDEDKEDDEDEESWGRKKSTYYSSNAAQLDSDDDDAHDMEEQEAKRLQAKLRDSMHDDDFGFKDAAQDSLTIKAADDFWKPIEKAPAVMATDKASLIRHLQTHSPETLALAYEWEDVAISIIQTEEKMARIESSEFMDKKALGLAYLHHQTQLTYAAVLAFYLHLRASEKYSAKPELLGQHPILKRLLTLKQSLSTLEQLNDDLSDEDEFDSDDFDDNESDLDLDDLDSWKASRKLGLDIGELEGLLNVAEDNVKQKSSAASETQKSQPPKKKRKMETSNKPAKVIFDVEEPTLSRHMETKPREEISSDLYGETTTLDTVDAVDKSIRRKALRFHTAKIESASNRRQGARNAMGGDDDIPYRQRNKELASKRKLTGLGEGGDDLDDQDPERQGQSEKRVREESSENDSEGDDGYYSLVKKRKKDKDAKKKAEYEAAKETNGVDFGDDKTEGQRSISRAILSNKGLTPKRSKSVRNPRVKKRLKFDKAKKKLSSQKAVYKGGIGDAAGYDGERSGISKVIKSVKL